MYNARISIEDKLLLNIITSSIEPLKKSPPLLVPISISLYLLSVCSKLPLIFEIFLVPFNTPSTYIVIFNPLSKTQVAKCQRLLLYVVPELANI